MKASDYIQSLKQLISQHGDLEVMVWEDRGHEWLESHPVFREEDGFFESDFNEDESSYCQS